MTHPIATSFQDKQYASLLKSLDIQRANYAGHYYLASFGCGSSCVVVLAVDILNGRVIWLPVTISATNRSSLDWTPVDYRIDSRLLVAHGALNEQGDGLHYYELINGVFRPI